MTTETEKIIDDIAKFFYRETPFTLTEQCKSFLRMKIQEARKQALSEPHDKHGCKRCMENVRKETAEAILSLTDKISTLHDPTDCDCCERMVEKNWQLREEIEKYLSQDVKENV